MNRNILAHAATKLRDLQDRLDSKQVAGRFDLDHWWANIDYFDDDENSLECSTAGCFIGWACQENWFKDFGYEMTMLVSSGRGHMELMPSFNGKVCINNASVEEQLTRMFGFKHSSTVEFLIYSEHYAEQGDNLTPLVVAEQIESLLEVGEDAFVESR